MNIKTARIALLTGLGLILIGSVAAQPAQSHPLSQIIPIDTDLDMSGYEIGNSSQITLDEGTKPEGLVLDDLTITHEGRAQRLVLDYQNNEWSIENSDLALNGNNISGFFGAPCPAGEFVVDLRNNGDLGCVSATSELQDDYVNRAGDTMTGSLDMQGNPFLGVNRIESNGTGITFTNSGNTANLLNLQENGNLDLLAGNLEGVRNLRLVDSGNTDQYTLVYDGTNGRLALSNAGEDVLRIDDSTNNLILPGGGLDMRSSNIVNFFGSACASGNVMVQVNSDGTFGCVDATNQVQDDFVARTGDSMTGNLDMRGNNIIAPGEVNGVNLTNPGNGIVISGNQYTIPTDAIQTNELDETASYNLGWGNLAISQTDISLADVGSADTNLDMNGYSITNYYGSACPTGEVMVDVRDNGNFGCVNVTSEVQDTYVNRAGDTMTGNLDMNGNAVTDTTGTLTLGGGNVEVSSGNLNMNSNNINAINTLNNAGTTLKTGGDISVGSGTVTSSRTMCIGDQC